MRGQWAHISKGRLVRMPELESCPGKPRQQSLGSWTFLNDLFLWSQLGLKLMLKNSRLKQEIHLLRISSAPQIQSCPATYQMRRLGSLGCFVTDQSTHRYRRHNPTPTEMLDSLVAFLIENDFIKFLHGFKPGLIRDYKFVLVNVLFSRGGKRG